MSRGMETGMDDCVAAVALAAMVATCRRRVDQPQNEFQVKISVAFATCRTVTSSVQIRCHWRPLAQRCLHGTLRPASCIRVVVQAPHDRRPHAVCHATVASRCNK